MVFPGADKLPNINMSHIKSKLVYFGVKAVDEKKYGRKCVFLDKNIWL